MGKKKKKLNMQDQDKKKKNWLTGQYLPMLNSLTNATPFPQPLREMYVSVTSLVLSIEKRPV